MRGKAVYNNIKQPPSPTDNFSSVIQTIVAPLVLLQSQTPKTTQRFISSWKIFLRTMFINFFHDLIFSDWLLTCRTSSIFIICASISPRKSDKSSRKKSSSSPHCSIASVQSITWVNSLAVMMTILNCIAVRNGWRWNHALVGTQATNLFLCDSWR